MNFINIKRQRIIQRLSVFVQHRCRVLKCVITETAVASGVTNAVTSAVGVSSVTSQDDNFGCSEYEKIVNLFRLKTLVLILLILIICIKDVSYDGSFQTW